MVAGVDMGGEGRLVLAPEDAGDLGGQAAEDQAVGVDDVPGTVDVGGLGRERAHEKSLFGERWAGVGAPAGAAPVEVRRRTRRHRPTASGRAGTRPTRAKRRLPR